MKSPKRIGPVYGSGEAIRPRGINPSLVERRVRKSASRKKKRAQKIIEVEE